MELLAYYLPFCIIVGLALLTASHRHSKQRYWEITPEVALVVSFFLYTSAMPLSRFLWRTDSQQPDVGFMQTHLLAALGMLFGLVAGKLLSPPKADTKTIHPLPAIRCFVLSTGTLLAFLAYIYYSVGFNLSNMLKPYGFETSINPSATTLDTLLEPAVCGLMLHCYLSTSLFHTQQPRLQRYVLVVAALMAAVFIARGERNPAMILCLPIFAIAFRNRRIPAFKATAAALTVFVLFSVVAAVRNFGLLDAGNAELSSSTLDPLRGELGTSYHVFSIFNSIAYADELQYGKTYTVDLGVNLIPHALWPDRPPSTAIKFSMRYYGTEALTEGAGFSPVVEAMANFPEVGIPFVFAAFAFLVVATANYLRGKGRWGLLSYAMMLPMLVNWNRIDSNTSFKMFAVYVAFFIGYDWLIYRRAAD